MAEYIEKSALVAEIKNLGNTYKKCPTRNSYEEGLKDGRLIGYEDALNKINTLEVKEVDLEKEYEKYYEQERYIQTFKLAKHFFELGIKAQVQSVWHNYLEPIEIDKTILIVSPNGNSSLALWNGKELLSTTLGGGHGVLCKGDQWTYIEDLNKAQKGE